jgi:hypothetical protein
MKRKEKARGCRNGVREIKKTKQESERRGKVEIKMQETRRVKIKRDTKWKKV